MPPYQQGSNAAPLQAIYPQGLPAVVWNAETPALGTKSLAVAIGHYNDNAVPNISVVLLFSAAPGTFEIDVQEADEDIDTSYVSNANGAITAVNTNNAARLELQTRARFVRLIVKTVIQNAVTLIAKIAR